MALGFIITTLQMNVLVWVIKIYNYDGKGTRGYENTSRNTDMLYGENNWFKSFIVYLHRNVLYQV
jgi:hypothetical protein